MSKSVVFSSCSRIACASQASPDVVLCLTDDTLLLSGRTTIDGVLTNVYKDNGACNTFQWRYVVSYDNTLLVDPLVALSSADITGIFCKGCLTSWVMDVVANLVPAEVTNLPAVIIPFGALTNAYVATNFLDVEGKARSITILNNTNQDVQISYDGVTDGPIIAISEYRQLNYASNGAILYATDIYIKYLNAVAPTIGEVNMDGYY